MTSYTTDILLFTTNSFWLASLFVLIVGLNLSFLIGMHAWFFKITKVVSFESIEVFCKDLFLTLYFSLFINDLPAFLPSSVSCFHYGDNLAIWFFPPWSLSRWNPYKELYFDCSAGLSTVVSLLIKSSFLSVDSHQVYLEPCLFLFNSHLRFNPTPTFSRITFDRTLSFF